MKKSILTMLLLSSSMSALATMPSGSWTLANKSSDVKDYFIRVDVDSGESYNNTDHYVSSVYWAQKISFENAPKDIDEGHGHIGLQRMFGKKVALVSIRGALEVKEGILETSDCVELEYCSGLNSDYDWKVGHNYRFRIEKSPRSPSDSEFTWWQISLADLTKGTIEILGEIKTPTAWGGMKVSNDAFLEYFYGSEECNTLPHAKGTLGQIRGNYGTDHDLVAANATPVGNVHHCDQKYILPSMPQSKYDSTAWMKNGTLTLLGNAYRGIHLWDDYQNNAKKGMFFAKDPNAAQPYLYQALHDGKFGYFPAEGSDNSHWKSIGKGYPIINDLYARNQKVYAWGERHQANVKIGDFFIYENPRTGDTEYFKLKKLDDKNNKKAFFPTDKSDNEYWTYVGRYPKSDDKLNADIPVQSWGSSNRVGKKNTLYYNSKTKMYFSLKKDGGYWYLPSTAEDNEWWTFVGYNR